MRAIVTNPAKKNSVKLVNLPKPVPKRKEALLRTTCVGIDGTDREINEGLYGTLPEDSDHIVLGHEALATIEKIEETTSGFSAGDLVVPTVRRPCQENCLNCRTGEVDMCLTGNYFEHGIYKLDGFASDYAVSDPRFLIKVPEELKDIAVLLEPMSVAEKAVTHCFKIQQRTSWKPKKALVNGAGPVGLLTTLILRLRGLEVYAAATRTKDSQKSKIVNCVGGTYVNVVETPITELKEKFDIIIEATGNVSAALGTLDALGANGILCFLGIYREKLACEEFGKVLTSMVLKNQVIFGSVSSNKTHFETGVEDMLKIKRRFKSVLNQLITNKIQVHKFREAFQPTHEEIKTVICFD
ncbi:glucose 1-dehydrogenase [Candidatus Bathyarchaeota archaeon]|nr:glucose 1-dehydrogenase [Candidatus Bathyarchaeota archaeon]